MPAVGTLYMIRHGQSQWNLENRFTGWVDVPLTENGRKDAALAGQALKGIKFDVAFSSRLKRANDTLAVLLQESGQPNVPTEFDSALNERHYGELQGLNKAETAEKYGADQVQQWRRSYHTQPPGGESMADCERRTLPFFKQYVWPHLVAGKNVIISAHGNSQRPIIKFLEELSEEEAAALEIGFCTPYVYTIDGEKMTHKEIMTIEGITAQVAALKQK